MAHGPRRHVVLWLLVAGLGVIGVVATKLQVDKRRLAVAHTEAQAALDELERERAHLAQELSQMRQTVEDQTGDLTAIQARLAETEQEITRLRHEQASLLTANTDLTQRLALATHENTQLEARLSSLKELRAAIRTVKRQLWQERWKAWLARIEAQRLADREALSNGNRGFVVRHGVPTLGTVTKLQVRVLEPQTQ